MEKAVQSASVDIRASLQASGVKAHMYIEEEEEVETEAAMEPNTTTLEQSPKAVTDWPTIAPFSICSTTVSSHTPTTITIYSMFVIGSQFPPYLTPTSANCNAMVQNPAFLIYAFGESAYSSSSAQSGAHAQSTMCAQVPIYSPLVAPSHPFSIHLDPADMDS